MRTFAKPRIVVSKCLEFAPCRYNGAMISDELVRRLKEHVDFVPVCPEMEVGLGCPREPIRVVLADKQLRLVQPATGRDVTQAMQQFAASFLAGVGEVGRAFPVGAALCGRPAFVGAALRGCPVFGAAAAPGQLKQRPGGHAGPPLRRHAATAGKSSLIGLCEVDGFILKGRSPSCGIKDVKVFAGPEHKTPQELGRGFFGGAALERFPDLPVEDEGRLSNFSLREHFLARLFALAAFRRVRAAGRMGGLVAFHAANKWLLMACHQSELRLMGRIVANAAGRPPAEVLAEYQLHLARALSRPPRAAGIINVLMHALGYVSDNLSAAEKAFFLDTLQKYRDGKAPLSAATTLLRAWGIRFKVDYLLEQTFLDPYPESLVSITDSGKGREM